MHAPGKDQQRKKVLQSTVYNLVEAEPEDKYVDLGITCVRKDDKDANILSGVPPLRLYFRWTYVFGEMTTSFWNVLPDFI